jgi:hypothetical protein
MPIWVDEGRFPQGGDFPDGVGFPRPMPSPMDFNVVQGVPTSSVVTNNVFLKGPHTAGLFIAESEISTVPVVTLSQASASVAYAHAIYKFAGTVQTTTFTYNASQTNTFSGILAGVRSQVSSFWRTAQLNPGVLPHEPNVFSDLFVFDVFAMYTSVNRRAIHFVEKIAATIFTPEEVEKVGSIVATDYYTTISGSVDVCENDGEPPFITLFSPTTSGIHLRPRDQIIDFALTDAVGGVDLSTITVNIDSPSTSGVLNIVQNGIDQTGGNVSVIGTVTSYRFTYTPPFLWDYNEQVLVTISGSDLPPEVGGNPFYCGAEAVNTFIGDIPFQILNFDDLPAEITAVGDIAPPYVSQTSPASGTVGNSVFTSVSLHLSDDLTGVDLSSVVVSIDGLPIVNAGVPTTGEADIVGTVNDYTITYAPDTSFNYGQTVLVEVVSQDRAYPSPNAMYNSYTFGCIDDSSLVIDGFQPAVGTHVNPEDVDVVVDVTDATHGVDSAQTFFVINGTIVSGTRVAITDGFRLTYHPPNDFAYNEPMRVTVHGANTDTVAPVIKESFYSLFYGCRVFMFNEEPFNHLENVDVFVRARNNEQLHKDLTTGYFFTTYTQPQAELGASIEAINPQKNLPATLNAEGPEHRYGETVTVEFSVEDFDGRILGPYIYTYTIENRPE